jgi:TolB-like protein
MFTCVSAMSADVKTDARPEVKPDVKTGIKTVAVLPFSIHSGESIDYIQRGVWDMLITRIGVSGKIDVLGRHTVVEALGGSAKADMTQEDALSFGKKLKVDYVVWGSITKIGNSVSLDGKLLETASSKAPVGVFTQSQGLDDVIGKVNDFAKRVDTHILGQVPATFDQLPAPAAQPAAAPAAPATAAVIPPGAIPARKDPDARDVFRSGKGTYTSFINPDFITSGQDRRGFWMSPKYEVEFKGMAIGDVDGDGLNEIVTIDNKTVRIYRKKGQEIKLAYPTLVGKAANNYLAVDIADINGNGIKEIFVTCYTGEMLNSFVLEYSEKDRKFHRIATDLKVFFRVIENSSGWILIGQTMGTEKPFMNPIHEYVWEDGKYKEGRKIKAPLGTSIYGLTIDRLDNSSSDMLVVLDDFDHLMTCEETDLPLERLQKLFGKGICQRTEEDYGGSSNFFDFPVAMYSNPYSTDAPPLYYINTRILTYDTNGDGKREVIVVKNLSPIGKVLGNVKSFNASEIHNLEWDGAGLIENWRTRKITGYVADYQIKDVGNDGEVAVVLALVTGSSSRIVTYNVRAPKPQQ